MTQENLDHSHFELHIPVPAPKQAAPKQLASERTAPIQLAAEQTAIDILHERLHASNIPFSKQKIKSIMANGAVWLESDTGIQRLRRAKKIIPVNSIIHLYFDERIQNTKPEEAELIADNKDYSIWNKPYGMYSQGTKWGDHCTIYRWAETQLKPQRKAFLVHRLDRAATGLMILAHSKTMASTFSNLFKNREIQKCYKAKVTGNLKELKLPHPIKTEIDNKSATSTITSVKQLDNSALLTIEIETGRKHQIRKHLSEIGFPIIGDRLYGSQFNQSESSENLQLENLQLQSYYLKFECPISNEIVEYSI